jgi:hypothetical protein
VLWSVADLLDGIQRPPHASCTRFRRRWPCALHKGVEHRARRVWYGARPNVQHKTDVPLLRQRLFDYVRIRTPWG